MLQCKTLGKFVHSIHCSSSLSYMNEYLTTDSGGYLCMNTLRALIAAWLDFPREVEMFLLNFMLRRVHLSFGRVQIWLDG